jgi:hypothetical protein
MSYLPKSKINIKEATSSDGFETISSNKFYVGPYIETSDGKYFAGNSIINRGEEIFKLEDIAINFGDSKDFKNYNKIKKSPYNFLVKTKPIPSTKNIPTEKDYEIGYYNRYFSSRVNQQFGYQEISFKTYKSINSENEEYDHYLHDVGLIKWGLKGNVYQINTLQLKTLERTFPYINHLFPILNEFHRPDLQVQTHLTTEGEELYYSNGDEYVGSYHIHPVNGPMEGDIHKSSSHPKLYYSDQLSQDNSTIDEEYKKYLNRKRKEDIINRPTATRDQTRTTPSRETTPSRGSTPSPTGGGGY